MGNIIVFLIMGCYKTQLNGDEKIEFELGLEEEENLGDYPDGFNPGLYDL